MYLEKFLFDLPFLSALGRSQSTAVQRLSFFVFLGLFVCLPRKLPLLCFWNHDAPFHPSGDDSSHSKCLFLASPTAALHRLRTRVVLGPKRFQQGRKLRGHQRASQRSHVRKTLVDFVKGSCGASPWSRARLLSPLSFEFRNLVVVHSLRFACPGIAHFGLQKSIGPKARSLGCLLRGCIGFFGMSSRSFECSFSVRVLIF
jgi:hypothetical protein